MLPGSALGMSKPISFMDGTGSGPHHLGTAATPGISAAANGTDGLPTYGQIMSSDDSIAQKATSFYQVSRARLSQQFANVQPWSEFFDRAFFAAPQGTTDVINRLNRNIAHFYSNYVILSLLCSSYVLLINPAFSISVAVLAAFYLYVRGRAAAMAVEDNSDGLIYLGGKGFTPMQLYMAMGVAGLVLFYMTSGSSVIFWLVITSLGVTCGHASMRRPPLEENSAFQLA